eukprot:CAMPEP_0195538480 /NCGR_PEP_ID=MMETSP0794_2-20130614/49543_1 /TAXON_ID=515487 /ORGANISM="Stephanopyxis turris, Strain CCMP 815" /LENGTH=695 /DNA_ID=CAMNT_0040672463 /DNA_START=73 /DNA_END=2160 /DNA_ORIENTATION=-
MSQTTSSKNESSSSSNNDGTDDHNDSSSSSILSYNIQVPKVEFGCYNLGPIIYGEIQQTIFSNRYRGTLYLGSNALCFMGVFCFQEKKLVLKYESMGSIKLSKGKNNKAGITILMQNVNVCDEYVFRFTGSDNSDNLNLVLDVLVDLRDRAKGSRVGDGSVSTEVTAASSVEDDHGENESGKKMVRANGLVYVPHPLFLRNSRNVVEQTDKNQVKGEENKLKEMSNSSSKQEEESPVREPPQDNEEQPKVISMDEIEPHIDSSTKEQDIKQNSEEQNDGSEAESEVNDESAFVTATEEAKSIQTQSNKPEDELKQQEILNQPRELPITIATTPRAKHAQRSIFIGSEAESEVNDESAVVTTTEEAKSIQTQSNNPEDELKNQEILNQPRELPITITTTPKAKHSQRGIYISIIISIFFILSCAVLPYFFPKIDETTIQNHPQTRSITNPTTHTDEEYQKLQQLLTNIKAQHAMELNEERKSSRDKNRKLQQHLVDAEQQHKVELKQLSITHENEYKKLQQTLMDVKAQHKMELTEVRKSARDNNRKLQQHLVSLEQEKHQIMEDQNQVKDETSEIDSSQHLQQQDVEKVEHDYQNTIEEMKNDFQQQIQEKNNAYEKALSLQRFEYTMQLHRASEGAKDAFEYPCHRFPSRVPFYKHPTLSLPVLDIQSAKKKQGMDHSDSENEMDDSKDYAINE